MGLQDFAQIGGYQPPDPIATSPLFVWPPKLWEILRWLCGFPGYLFPWTFLYAMLAVLSWTFLTPNLTHELSPASIGVVFLKNLPLIALFAGSWHLLLYVKRSQETDYKYNSRWLSIENPKFLFGRQFWDNIFWTVISAVPVWTAYELITLRLQMRGLLPCVSWREHPIYCLLLLLVIPIFQDTHFYVIHRLIHWRPLYAAMHSLHHKNINPGPWSGLAMHPLEHVLYFSTVLVHWIIASHPIHVLFHLQYTALSPALSHCGFHTIVFNKRLRLNTEQYTHYLHHKYFKVNYGGDIVPLDKWFGTFHDGSTEAQQSLTRRMRKRNTDLGAES